MAGVEERVQEHEETDCFTDDGGRVRLAACGRDGNIAVMDVLYCGRRGEPVSRRGHRLPLQRDVDALRQHPQRIRQYADSLAAQRPRERLPERREQRGDARPARHDHLSGWRDHIYDLPYRAVRPRCRSHEKHAACLHRAHDRERRALGLVSRHHQRRERRDRRRAERELHEYHDRHPRLVRDHQLLSGAPHVRGNQLGAQAAAASAGQRRGADAVSGRRRPRP